MTVQQVKESIHDLHPVDWSKANARKPSDDEQHEYWQFRINKSKGRVVGMLIAGVFYVVWLDPNHNLTNSEGYGKERYYRAGLSLYEKQELVIEELQKENTRLSEELKTAEELLNEKCT